MNSSSSQVIQLFFYHLRLFLTTGTVVVILLTIIGYTIRDRTILLAFLMYIPLLPLGLWVILLDLWQGGYSLPKFRFSLTFFGFVLVFWGTLLMTGASNGTVHAAHHKPVSLLQWNVKWAGLDYYYNLENPNNTGEWAEIREKIHQHNPDIIVLTDPPQVEAWLAQLTQQMGTGSSMLKYYHTEYNGLAIFSSWPLQFERLVRFRYGIGMSVVVTMPEQVLRLLLIDADSDPQKLRTPLLTDIIQTAIDSDKEKQPIDIMVGDFNAVSRSIGFDTYPVAAGGYQLASKFARIWRGTWPSFLPVFDIDHVWIHKRFQVLSVKTWSQQNIDHRGQLVYFN